MDPLAHASHFVDGLVRKLVIAALLVAAAVAGWLHLHREPTGTEQFAAANPGWTVTSASFQPVRADDASGRGEVMLRSDDLGPVRIRRVDCDEVRAAWPSWFVLPDVPLGNCARLDDAGQTSWVLNVRTPMPVTHVWDRHFGPLLDRSKLGYGGGRSGPLSRRRRDRPARRSGAARRARRRRLPDRSAAGQRRAADRDRVLALCRHHRAGVHVSSAAAAGSACCALRALSRSLARSCQAARNMATMTGPMTKPFRPNRDRPPMVAISTT